MSVAESENASELQGITLRRAVAGDAQSVGAVFDAADGADGVVGFTAVHAEDGERNTRARAVYAAAGYRPDGALRESDFGGEPLCELRLVKAL